MHNKSDGPLSSRIAGPVSWKRKRTREQEPISCWCSSRRGDHGERGVSKTTSPPCVKDRRTSFRSRSQREIWLSKLCSARSSSIHNSNAACSGPEM